MGAILRRSALPTLLLMTGIGSLVYGMAFRTLPILVDTPTEIEKEVIPPAPPPPPMPSGPGGPGGPRPPWMAAPPPPRPQKVLVTVIEPQLQQRPEPQVVKDVTVGGVARLADGRLKLTYTLGEEGPALCPT